MSISTKDLHKALKTFFGFDKFKGLQEQVIKSLLEKQNTFAIMPTGGGKSLCYQLPALMQDGVAIVVSPLIALMKNQVDAIRGISKHEGIAHVLNSSLNKTEIKQVKSDIESGITKLLYVAPESLSKAENIEFLSAQTISFMAVDEAHCISEWGHDFRPEYRNLKQIISQIGDNISIIGLTATATPKVQEDILKNLGTTDSQTLQGVQVVMAVKAIVWRITRIKILKNLKNSCQVSLLPNKKLVLPCYKKLLLWLKPQCRAENLFYIILGKHLIH